jgi:hypothetical protein
MYILPFIFIQTILFCMKPRVEQKKYIDIRDVSILLIIY